MAHAQNIDPDRMSHSAAQSQPSASSPELVARDLEIWRGETRLFDSFSFHVSPGETVWLRGPNGAGKTTLMRVVLGLSHAEAGHIEWRGQDRDADREEFLSDVVWCGHLPGLRGELSPRENLAAWLPLRGPGGRDSIDEALATVGLEAHADRPCLSLSAGQARRAGLARLLLSDAALWCLDEPLTSLDAEGQQLLGRLIDGHRRAGGSVLVSSHQALPESAGPVRTLDIGTEADA